MNTGSRWFRPCLQSSFLLAAGMTALLTTSAFAQATLTGEVFSAGPLGTTAISCSPEGATFSYSVSGIATGPYPGPFTETGVITMGPVVGPDDVRQLLSFDANFSIDSPAGQVIGSKTLPEPPPPIEEVGVCDPDTGAVAVARVQYEARIVPSEGKRFTDHGTSEVLVIQNTKGDGLEETFASECQEKEKNKEKDKIKCKKP